MIDGDLPFELHNALRRELANGEVIVRLERPDPARFKIVSGWIGVAFGVMVIVGALYVMSAVASGKSGWSGGEPNMPAFAVIVIVLACVGLGAPWSYRHAARNTAYAITNQRALIVRISMFGVVVVQAVPGRSLKPRATRYADGVGGDIELVAGARVDDDLQEDVGQLIALRDVRATEAALLDLVQSSSKSSP